MSEKAENYLGTEKIGRLLVKFSIPCILSMVIGALYNVVDQLFIGNSRLGYLGNAATSIVYPITIIVLAFGLMWGDGCAAYLSISQGRGDTSGTRRAIGSCIVYSVATGLLIDLICLLGGRQILTCLGASGETLAYAQEYLNILLVGIPFYLLATMLVSVVRADGSPRYSMVATCTGCILNIILDPVFIYGLDMGMAGAAWATVIGQLSCFVFMMVYIPRTKTCHLTAADLRPVPREVLRASQFGISSFLTNISTVALSVVTNILLASYGVTSVYGADIPIAVIGIVFKVFGIIISVAVGLAVGGQPILGYNYGAGNMRRVKETFITIVKCDIVIGLIATLLVEGIPGALIGIFGTGSELYISYGVLAFRIYMGLILITCLSKATSIFFQSIGHPVTAIAVALSRDIVFLIPGLFLFASLGGAENGVVTMLWAAPVSDVLNLALCLILVFRFFGRQAEQPEKAPAAAVVQPAAADALADCVITIGRSYGAGGRTVGRLVAEKLGIAYYDSELLEIAARNSGLSRKYLTAHDETPVDSAMLYRSVGLGEPGYDSAESMAEKAQREVIEQVAKTPCVIVGRKADQILAGRKKVLSVFIAGSRENRKQRLMAREGLSALEAEKLVRRADRQRAAYYNQTSASAWGAAESYDLCLNIDRLGAEKAAEQIAAMAGKMA